MATLSAILSNLRAEVEARIIDIAPTIQASTRFTRRTLTERANKTDMDEAALRPRLFQINEPDGVPEVHWLGYKTRASHYVIPIIISYPQAPLSWARSVYSDCDLIAADLREHTTTVAGCHYRMIDLATSPQITTVDVDDWIIARLNMRALLEVQTVAVIIPE